ncbi:Ohr family peroxiredoxin [Piscinibacter gummiphilus]|uniref:Peroxiredoxin n=1 Tax=Piscinibacter gummiphilus TaxID=946333 RepID=A0A1W6L350_9BURK|nr:Ohr family peroxiredoxin [Piscinibacter gummiphilus]ARN18699.1 peroxiredoxin [Piscinibacter gummiphilus]ATU63336.1 peroxiredoxin [Piscinibacter gummiphilus]GLS95846.1 organic hydroperoxide resistance protein [Piscinibacter gummiphilus]
MIRTIDKSIYTATTVTTGGREGTGTSSDGALDVALSLPGSGGRGTNPEQLLAVGYSACFLGAMRRVKTADHTRVPDDASIEAQVTLGVAGDGGFALAVRLKVDLPGLSDAQKWALVDGAHDLCPYSLALRGNIEIELAIG